MSPKLSAFFVSALLVAGSAAAQCDYQFRSSAPYRASILDLAVDGNDLWAATGYGVQLYDRSVDPPKLVATVSLPGITSVVRAANGVAYAGGTMRIAAVSRVNKSSRLLVAPIPFAGVTDLALVGTTLYAASPAGITAFNATDLSQLSTLTNAGVTALATTGSTLYAAEGTTTIEVFSGTQKTGTVTSQLRATSVEAIGSRLYASDGFRTEVFNGSTSLGILPYPARSIADLGSNVVMIAGNDRQLRALDTSTPQSFVELFDDELPPSGGTVNRVTALRAAGGRVYAGGGDIGLATYDVSHFAAPYPMRAYAVGATSSVVALPNAVYATLASGGIQEMTRNGNGGLFAARTWDTNEKLALQDGSGTFLLSSSGTTLTDWFLPATTPSIISTATFVAPVRSAFFTATASAIALTQDGTLWTVDLSQATPSPVRVASNYSAVTQLAHSTTGIAATELSSDATATTVHFWTDPNATPIDVRVPGAATALALNGSTAAVFTFRGITVIDFTTSSQNLLRGSNAAIATALAISGNKVIAQTQKGTVRVWDITTGALEKEFAMPGGANAISAIPASTSTGVATGSGIATIDYSVASSQPLALARIGANAYYKKAVAGGGRLYLFDGRVIDIYTFAGDTPVWSGSVLAPGTLDLAASDSALFTLSNSEVVTEYSSAGVQLRSKALDEGSDVTPSGIASVGGTPWVSFSRGCTTAACEQRTDVLDPQSLVATASFAGSVVDVTTSGSRAFAIFNLPSEIRAYDISDPLHPSQSASIANDNKTVAIAFDGTVYALGDKVYAYTAALSASGSQLPAQKPASSADLVADGGCATIAGRSSSGEMYALPSWTASNTIPVPGNVRSMLFASGKLILLTDYSIEVWSRNAAPPPSKRRAAGN